MGPDCGTALIGGAGIGFANAVRRGPIGVVGGSGTGMQELTCLVHRAGSGISHAIGAGGRDLSDKIGGLSTFTGLDALEADERTKVIVMLSKPPGAETMRAVVEKLRSCRKPTILCLFDSTQPSVASDASINGAIRFVSTIDQAASLALEIVETAVPAFLRADIDEIRERARAEAQKMARGQRYIRGIFAGGTFCYQSQIVIREGGLAMHSNGPTEGIRKLVDLAQSKEHSLVDMGAEEFIEGRPHPMIDATLRRERIFTKAPTPRSPSCFSISCSVPSHPPTQWEISRAQSTRQKSWRDAMADISVLLRRCVARRATSALGRTD